MKLESNDIGVGRQNADDFPPFLPLPQLQVMRKTGKTDTRSVRPERPMTDFRLSAAGQSVTFRYGVDFVDGNDRLRWTPAGIDKLLSAGLWRREFDARGNLKSKPVMPEAAMSLPGAQPLV